MAKSGEQKQTYLQERLRQIRLLLHVFLGVVQLLVQSKKAFPNPLNFLLFRVVHRLQNELYFSPEVVQFVLVVLEQNSREFRALFLRLGDFTSSRPFLQFLYNSSMPVLSVAVIHSRREFGSFLLMLSSVFVPVCSESTAKSAPSTSDVSKAGTIGICSKVAKSSLKLYETNKNKQLFLVPFFKMAVS